MTTLKQPVSLQEIDLSGTPMQISPSAASATAQKPAAPAGAQPDGTAKAAGASVPAQSTARGPEPSSNAAQPASAPVTTTAAVANSAPATGAAPAVSQSASVAAAAAAADSDPPAATAVPPLPASAPGPVATQSPATAAATKPAQPPAAKPPAQAPPTASAIEVVQPPAAKPPVTAGTVSDSDSEDDMPLAQRKPAAPASAGMAAGKPVSNPAGKQDNKPVKKAGSKAVSTNKARQPKQPGEPHAAAPAVKRKLENGSAKSLANGSVKKAKVTNGTAKSTAKRQRVEESSDDEDSGGARTTTRQRKRQASEPSRQPSEPENKEVKWTTLEHAGVMFPPEYTRLPDNVKLLYEGRPVELTTEQEEVATFYAVMIKTDYMQKETFNRNFWDGFKALLGRGHVIKDLKKCDFTAMYEYFMAQRELKKQLSKEEKERIKAEKDEVEKKYKTAKVDGRVEQVGNFRVEPPGLFRGRGEHPKMGRIKRRIYPKDIVINIGKGVPIPEHPYPDQHWKMIRHDNTVTWLAFWHDPVTHSSFKYVWLAANSSFKSESDQAKYEKARKLKQYIGGIRAQYEKDWLAKDEQKAQIATALYFIDILALRAGHEKDEEEADTVGCCNLKAENVKCLVDDLKPNTIEFDFLGKDSVQYTKEVEVAAAVYRNIGKWTQKTVRGKPKKPEDQLFDSIDAQDLNKTLKDCMEGLSAKVFRTYNASVTLDRLLTEQEEQEAEARAEVGEARQKLESPTMDKRKADYDRANKEVAILCNHQRAVGKAHDSQMEKLSTRMAEFKEQLDELHADLKLAKAGKEREHPQSGKMQKLDPHAVQMRIRKKKDQIVKAELQAKVKEDLKTVALGTSKINYLDPRISVSWCKRNEVPMEKIFNKSLLSKFHWAMDVAPDFRF